MVLVELITTGGMNW